MFRAYRHGGFGFRAYAVRGFRVQGFGLRWFRMRVLGLGFAASAGLNDCTNKVSIGAYR